MDHGAHEEELLELLGDLPAVHARLVRARLRLGVGLGVGLGLGDGVGVGVCCSSAPMRCSICRLCSERSGSELSTPPMASSAASCVRSVCTSPGSLCTAS